MKPAMFEYYRAANLREAIQFMEEHGGECKIIAGGQSLVPLLNMRVAQPGCLIDINSLSELDYIVQEGETIKIGALTRQKSLESNELIMKSAPVLVEAVKNVGHPQTRNRGTVGGSLAHAEPSAEISLAMLALEADVTITGAEGTRKVPVDQFLVSEFTTVLTEKEILTEVSFNTSRMLPGYAFEEFAIRHGDFAIASALSLIDADSRGLIREAKIVLGGIEARPVLLEGAPEVLLGMKLTDSTVNEVFSIIESVADVSDDMHSSSEYKINLSKVMLEKSLRRAYDMAIMQEGVH